MRFATLLLASLTLAASCGGSSDPNELTRSGQKALGSNDYATAVSDFEAALSAIGGDTTHPNYIEAKLGAIEARAIVDATRSKDELIALSNENPGKVTDRDFVAVATRMESASKFAEAIALLDAGKKQYPDSEALDKLGNRLAEAAEASGDTSALDALAGLGYMGE